MKKEQTGCSETLEFKLQTSVNEPEGSTQHSQQGESLKSGMRYMFRPFGKFESRYVSNIHGNKRLKCWTRLAANALKYIQVRILLATSNK
jgi:hypothetical protein